MTRLYVAGPMTGLPEWNFPAFREAAVQLRAAGYVVVSPHELDESSGFDPASDGAGFDLRDALYRDLAAIMTVDGIALLPGWEPSPGVAVELTMAAAIGIEARPVDHWVTLPSYA